jgi:hypothetical protein
MYCMGLLGNFLRDASEYLATKLSNQVIGLHNLPLAANLPISFS